MPPVAHVLSLAALACGMCPGPSLAAGTHPWHPGPPPAAVSGAAPTAAAMAGAMARMHEGMAAAALTGDADADFLRLMIPHHEGAVEMAAVVLLRTRDPRVRNLAQSIVTEQRYEIELMRTLLAADPAAASPPVTQETTP